MLFRSQDLAALQLQYPNALYQANLGNTLPNLGQRSVVELSGNDGRRSAPPDGAWGGAPATPAAQSQAGQSVLVALPQGGGAATSGQIRESPVRPELHQNCGTSNQRSSNMNNTQNLSRTQSVITQNLTQTVNSAVRGGGQPVGILQNSQQCSGSQPSFQHVSQAQINPPPPTTTTD